MEELLLKIVDALRHGPLEEEKLLALIRAHNAEVPNNNDHFAKKQILPFYRRIKRTNPARWESWNISEDEERLLIKTLRMKPRRTASGVATITTLTKPHACSGDCLYCPNDLRMPKSYLHDEPACQRAERNYFDPYLQMTARLHVLEEMGHPTDKVELIVLGGTFGDYPKTYQLWFIEQLISALNDDAETRQARAQKRRRFYTEIGLELTTHERLAKLNALQEKVWDHTLTYNQAITQLYDNNPAWQKTNALFKASCDVQAQALLEAQRANEHALHRVVGLVIETRPECIDADSLAHFRRLGCTKIQVGIQSLDDDILHANGRTTNSANIAHTFELLRAFGFKIHAHLMLNLLGATPEFDKQIFERFTTDPAFQPDEVKLYPCALVAGTGLVDEYKSGHWRPYTEDELIDTLTHDLRCTPPYLRVSRMIREISAGDILVGNKKTNLRQMVENKITASGFSTFEIRYREIGTEEVDARDLYLDTIEYETTNTQELFFQWITPENKIAGFLRLSLPKRAWINAHKDELPDELGQAMIREVHIYGRAAYLREDDVSTQHQGLGRTLIERACAVALVRGYTTINVISAIGTRPYYRRLGFVDKDLYQSKPLS